MAAALAITLNGISRHVSADVGLTDLLLELGISPDRSRGVAVALNDEVVPRAAWGSMAIREGDRLEVVTAKQGG
jgi:sulfur carrier protein